VLEIESSKHSRSKVQGNTKRVVKKFFRPIIFDQLFSSVLDSLPHKHKVVIAGNHELSFGYADKCVGQRLLQHLLGPSAESGLTKEVKEYVHYYLIHLM